MIIFGIVVLIFFWDRWVKYSLYPFDSLRSLRVTAVGRAFRSEPIGYGSRLLPLQNAHQVILSADGYRRSRRISTRITQRKTTASNDDRLDILTFSIKNFII